MKAVTSRTIPGINIRWPWSDLIATGKKTVETRGYRLPNTYLGKEIAIIETYGKGSKRKPAQIVAIAVFGSCFEYKDEQHWASDRRRHQVNSNDPDFKYTPGVPKWGWTITHVTKLSAPQKAPKRRGIVFAKQCKVELASTPS